MVHSLSVTNRSTHFHVFLAGLYVAGVFLLSLQPLITLMQSGFQGVLYKGGDESQYIMRVNEAMLRPWTDVSNPYVSGPGAPNGLQMTFLEMFAGSIFSWTELSAPALAIFISVFAAPLVIPLFAFLALRLGATKTLALVGAVLYFLLLLGPLRRTVHQAWSLPFVFATLLLIFDWWKSPTRARSVVLGAVLGLLPGIYFWAWSFGWNTFVCLALFTAFLEWRRGLLGTRSLHLMRAAGTGGIAFVASVPFLVLMWKNSSHPAAADAALQSSLVHAREFESVPRSVLLVLFVATATVSILRQPERRRFLPLLAILVSLVIVTHQQFAHGIVLSFWTHYYPYVCAAAVLVITVFLSARRRGRREFIAMFLASIFLVGAFADYKGRTAVFTPIQHYDKYQHLSVPVGILRTRPERQTVLSDLETALILGTYTKHDVVYTSFIRHTLISFRELAERYCLTQLITGREPDVRWLAGDVMELSAAGREEAARVYERDLRITAEACIWVYEHPKEALQKYGVTMALWDERNYPDWKPSAELFREIQAGAGWSLWSVR